MLVCPLSYTGLRASVCLLLRIAIVWEGPGQHRRVLPSLSAGRWFQFLRMIEDALVTELPVYSLYV